MIRTIRFGSIVSCSRNGQIVSHIPVDVEEDNDNIWLNAHISRANSHWKIEGDAASVAIFEGPHTYIRPSWLTAKKLHGKVVPTWNYVAIQAHGTIEIVHELAWLRNHLSALTADVEAGRHEPWALSDAPSDFIDKMLPHIVGLRLRVSKLTGIWKMSQHQSDNYRSEVINGLNFEDNPSAHQVASIMSNLKKNGTGNE